MISCDSFQSVLGFELQVRTFDFVFFNNCEVFFFLYLYVRLNLNIQLNEENMIR